MAEDRAGDRELNALRARLDALEGRLSEEIASIRARIDVLESGSVEEPRVTVKEPAAEPVVPEPARVMPPPLPPAAAEVTAPAMVVAEVPAVPIPEAETEGSFEMRFGRVWLVRIGIALLVTGLVLLGNHAYRNWIRDMPAGARLFALYLCAAALAETGRRLAKRGNLRAFGEVVLAGGLAFFYYCTFAAHHVARLRVIESPVVAAVLLALAAAGIAAVSWLRRAKGTAVLGLVLASYAVMLQPLGWMSCVSAVILAGTGLFFATRPGWDLPGWVSLLASYGSFVGWQFLGAARGAAGEPVLWFLPCVWLLFALPAVTGRFREAMGDRARAWFTGANNGLFFLLYTVGWLRLHGDASYWLVAAVMGAVWLACGVLGRRRSEAAGGTNVAQGLACLSLALVLKLDGWHLGLSLAGESVALAAAYSRFRGRSELAFAWLAAMASAAIQCGASAWDSDAGKVPGWSAAAAALLLMLASHLLWRGSRLAEVRSVDSRRIAAVVFGAGVVAMIGGWGVRLGGEWRGTALLAAAAVMAGTSFFIDRKRLWPEPAFGALALMLVSLLMMLPPDPVWVLLPMSCAVPLGVASCWLWRHRGGGAGATPPAFLGSWCSALISALAFGAAVTIGGRSGLVDALALCAAAFALASTGAVLRCGALAPAGALLSLAALVRWLPTSGDGPGGFAIFAAVVATAALVLVPGVSRRIGKRELPLMLGILRVAAFAAWVLAWYRANPSDWPDWLALSSVAGVLVARGLRAKPAPEVAGVLALSLAGWLVNGIDQGLGRLISGNSPGIDLSGWGPVLGLCAMVWPRSRGDARWKPGGPGFVASLLVIVSFVWVTSVTVSGYGWRGAAVSWTLLGFLLVTAGLAGRMRLLRVGGFLVIGAALVKVFAFDVWDFSTFLRVVAFLVLGAALLVLGLFYHRFAPVLRSLWESDPGRRDG